MDNNCMNSCGMRRDCGTRRPAECPVCYNQNDKTTAGAGNYKKEMSHMYDGIENLSLAMAYVPVQQYTQRFDLDRGLQEGTIFPELCLPFCGRRRKCSC